MTPRKVVLALALAMPLAQAETGAERLLKQDIDRREQERREQRWDDSHSPGVALPPPVTAPEPPAAAAGPCFPVREIRLHPQGVLSAPRTAAILAAYTGRCLSATDLAALQNALNAQALAQGLVTTRVVVPEQNLAAGALALEIWPGRLEAVQAPALSKAELALANPLQPGELLQLRALEQAVDNLNRLASFRASVELLPGEQPGGSIARLAVARGRPWQAALAWQGEALNEKETHSVRASAVADSPLRLADRLVLGVNGHLQDGQVDDAHGANVDYDLPWGWWRFSAGADRFDYRNPVKAGLTTFTASGKSRAWRMEAARSLYRDARYRVGLALHGRRRHNDNFIDDVTLGVSTTRLAIAGARLDVSRVAAPWVWDASLDLENGRGRSPALYAPLDGHYVRALGNTRLEYHAKAAVFSAALSGQWSDARLAPSEQFALTGVVQGFAPLGINANSGTGLQLEAARPIALSAAGLTSLRPSLGVAWALAPHAGGNLVKDEIAAATTGVTLAWKHAVASLGVAVPVNAINTVEAPQDWQLDASFSLQW
jgi:hemolysin activation/secretion protein